MDFMRIKIHNTVVVHLVEHLLTETFQIVEPKKGCATKGLIDGLRCHWQTATTGAAGMPDLGPPEGATSAPYTFCFTPHLLTLLLVDGDDDDG